MTVSTHYWPDSMARFVVKPPTSEEPGQILYHDVDGTEVDVGRAVLFPVEVRIGDVHALNLGGHPPTAKFAVILEIRQ